MKPDELKYSGPTCETCRFYCDEYADRTGEVFGLCHRYPPQRRGEVNSFVEQLFGEYPYGTSAFDVLKSPQEFIELLTMFKDDAMFARVRGDNWCGEHQPRT